ncbi:unnamed protein product [marine sediment metagenome]|uniref:Uncharacterized protein n=1 Tax=marine sediment metagenome TaxID=412755 RepID=X1UKU8_9ZZZZ
MYKNSSSECTEVSGEALHKIKEISQQNNAGTYKHNKMLLLLKQ